MKKSILTILLAVIMLVSGVVIAGAASPGDIDGDGKVTAADARLALRAAVGLENLSDPQKKLADIDGSGSVTAADARLILRMAVGLGGTSDDPLSPVFSAVDCINYKTVRFRWNAIAGVQGYEVSYKPVTSDDYNISTLSGTEIVIAIPGGVNYDVRIRSYTYENGTFLYSGYNTVTVRNTYFEKALYSVSHQLLGREEMYPGKKWCTMYVTTNVLRPALKAAGYPSDVVDNLCPAQFIPSLFANYYLTHSQYAESFIFYEYWDDIVTHKAYNRTSNADSYTPQIGDILFMSNKERTYVEKNGKTYMTIDHPAVIIEVYADGTFLCTEGSIANIKDDNTTRVVERKYYYNKDSGMYQYVNNSIVKTLLIVRPDYY